jgi:small-conductance mechanosensitive channel
LRQIAFIFSLLLCLFATAAWAQTPAPAEPASETAVEEPLARLLDVLRDDSAREALISELEARLDTPAETAEGEPAETEDSAETAPPDATLGGQIAVITQDVTQSAAETFSDIARQMRAVPRIFSALGRTDLNAIGGLMLDLGVLVLATYGVYLALRFVTEHFRRRLRLRAARSGWIAGIVALAVLLVSNLAMVLGAWAVGQILAVGVLSETGRASFHHALFLNAFLVVEAVQAVVRALLSPKDEPSRLVPVNDADAKMLTGWSRATTSVLAFGQLLLVPVFARYVSSNAGLAISVIVYVVALALMVNLVLRMKAPVSAWLERRTAHVPEGTTKLLARVWHLPVLAYLLVLFVVVILWPGPVLVDMLYATFTILLAVLLGIAAATLLSRLIMRGVKLPPAVSSRVPLLEQRLNAFVPRALTALRLLVFIVVAAITLDTIGLFSVGNWLETEFGSRFAGATITVSLILAVAFGAWLALSSWVDYQIQPSRGRPVNARKRTLLSLLRNAVTIAIVIFTAMFCLSEVGLDIAPLLASAGVIGLAVGFGAQRLVQDIITGIFIQLEGAMDVGDVVSIGGITGRVERLTIRSAGMRDESGVYHIIPFSSVTTVSNFMRGFAYAVNELNVGVGTDIETVHKAMSDAFTQLKADTRFKADIVASDIDWMGLEKFTGAAMTVRTRIKTLPGKQWAVGRAFNQIVRQVFAEREITIA